MGDVVSFWCPSRHRAAQRAAPYGSRFAVRWGAALLSLAGAVSAAAAELSVDQVRTLLQSASPPSTLTFCSDT